MADIASILVDGQNPSMPALRAWLQNLSASVGTLAGGFRTFSTLAELNAYVPSETDATYAFVISGEVFQGYRYDSAWAADDTFFKGLSAAAQESIDVIERKVDANTALISQAVLVDLLVNGTPQSYGTLAPAIANFVGAQSVGNNTPIVDPGVLARVRIKASGAAAGFLDVLTPVSGGFALRAFPITLAAGENIITTAVFGYLPMIAGSLVGWRQVSGAGILYANDAGGVGGVFVFPQSEAGDPVVTPDYSTSYSVALSFDVVAAPSMSVLLAALSGSSGQTVIGSIAPTTGNWEQNQSVSSITAVVVPSILQELQIRVSAASTGFLDAVDGSGKILQSVPTSLSAGLNTLTGDSLPQTTIPVGGRVFYRALTGGTLVYDTTTGANGVAVYFNNDAPDGQTSIIKATGFFVALKFTYKTYAVSVLARLDSIDARLNGANDGDTKALRADPSFVIDQQVYRGSALPANHGVTGSWSNTSSGQAITTGGGWSTFFYTGGYSNADRRAVSYVIKVNDAASVFGIAAQPQLGNARYGCVCMVDGAANKLRLYQWGGSGAGTLIKEAAMPTLIPNHDYAIRVDQDGLNATYTLTDQVTQTQSSLRFEWAVDKFETQPFFKGRPGVLFLSGAIVVKTMTIQAKTTKDLKAIIFGDSNSDGIVIDNVGGMRKPVTPSWATMAAASRFERDIMISVKASDRIEDALERIPDDLNRYQPKRVYIALGTNNTVLAPWRTAIAQMIAAVEAVGAEPILCCMMPAQGSSVHAAMNADIRAGYFGNYRYLDFAQAVSANNDGVTWNAAYVSAVDLTHLSRAGQEMYYKVLLNSTTLPV